MSFSIADTYASSLELERFLSEEFQEHRDAVEGMLRALKDPFGQVLNIWEEAIKVVENCYFLATAEARPTHNTSLQS